MFFHAERRPFRACATHFRRLRRRFHANCRIFHLDLDGFKEINDGLGHAAGDKVLQHAAGLLHRSICEADTAAKFGGDEFVVLLPNTDRADTNKVAERIVQQFCAPVTIDAQECEVRASIGISVYPRDGEAEDVLLRGADTALYRIKARGGNGYVYLSSETELSE